MHLVRAGDDTPVLTGINDTPLLLVWCSGVSCNAWSLPDDLSLLARWLWRESPRLSCRPSPGQPSTGWTEASGPALAQVGLLSPLLGPR